MDVAIPVKVAVRVRPLNTREKDENAKECVDCYIEHNQISLNGKMFAFDCIFDASSSQDVVYDQCAGPLVEKLFSGYNCTIFAYGQTGSGKTFTMGTEEKMETLSDEGRGIIPRIVDAIFNQIETFHSYSVTASMLEIYEEKVIDLLSQDRESLMIRELKGSVFVQDLSMHPVKTMADAMTQLEKGCQSRSKGETAMNDKSSRSHAIFTLCIEAAESVESGTFKSKLHLVDLAGSERLKKTQAEGERKREGIKINEGLLALGNVIAALAEQGGCNRHIPYRVSKITRLLQDSLGGNSYTVMIACVSPADTNAEETLSTLRYADRAKRIKNKPIVNIDPKLVLIQSLREEIANLKNELSEVRTGTHSYGMPVERWAEMEKEFQNLQHEHRRLNMRFAETVAKNSSYFGQLMSNQQAIEGMKEAIKMAISKLMEKNTKEELNDVLEILGAVKDMKVVIEEDLKEENHEDGEGEDEPVDQTFTTLFVEKQLDLNHEMACLLDEIKRKEAAFELTSQSQAEIEKMRITFAEESEKLQTKLGELEKERDELLRKLRGTATRHKISEERRRRLNELEKEVQSYKKRIAEIKRMEAENSRLQEQSKKLTLELTDLKKLRVKLLRQLKDEEVKFRHWKCAAERELMKMKNQGRKREMEATREMQTSKLQLAVYRRKYEEANACNRRLQQQLLRCTSRNANEHKEMQLTSALSEELAVAYSAAEAQIHCEVLIEQRKNLSEQQRRYKQKLALLDGEPPKKRRTASDHSGVDSDLQKVELEKRIKDLSEEIDLVSTELADINSKCVRAHSEERYEQRINNFRVTSDVKIALKHLFDAAVSEHRIVIEKETMNEELRRLNGEIEAKYSAEVDGLKMKMHNERSNVEMLRKFSATSELEHVKRQREMIHAWNELAEGRSDIAENFIKDLNLLVEANKQIEMLEMAIANRKRRSKDSIRNVRPEIEGSANANAKMIVQSPNHSYTDHEQNDDFDEAFPSTLNRLQKERSGRRRNEKIHSGRYSMLLREAPLNTILSENPLKSTPSSSCKSNTECDPNATFVIEKAPTDGERQKMRVPSDPLDERLLSVDLETLSKTLFDSNPSRVDKL